MELAKTFGVKVVVNSLLIEPNEGTDRHKADFDSTDVGTWLCCHCCIIQALVYKN